MAEPDGASPEQPDGDEATPHHFEEVLGNLKPGAEAADEPTVNADNGARPGYAWNPVTESGGDEKDPPRSASGKSGFTFDLGGALARLGGRGPSPDEGDHGGPHGADSQPPILDRRVRPSRDQPKDPADDPLAPIRGLTDDDALPRRRPPGTSPANEHTAEPPAPARPPGQPTGRSSVFVDQARIEPPRLPGSGTPTMPPSAQPSAPLSTRAAQPPSGAMPTLPASNPAAPPPVAAPIESAPAAPDLHALRSAQMRANRQQRQGRLFGRSLLAFIVIGGLIAAALTFGRSYLFPTEWDAALTPIVDQIQLERGVEFDHTIPLVVEPAAEFDQRVLAVTGGDWIDRVPQWRALGLAGADATPETVTAILSAATPALYDPESDTIYRSDDADPAVLGFALRSALESAFERQLGGGDDAGSPAPAAIGFTGVSPLEVIARRAVEHYAIARNAPVPEAAGQSSDDGSASTGVPVPVAYELRAVESLGEALLTGAGIDPTTFALGDPLPATLADELSDVPRTTAGALLLAGDEPLGDPVALGLDDWSLVWGVRLPESTVAGLVGIVTADSYRPVYRSGTVCFMAVFQTAGDVDGNTVLSAMSRWAADAPAASRAVATLVSPDRVQLEACDPGGEARAPDLVTVDALLNRQIARIAT